MHAKVDKTLSGFIDQLLSQHRRTALPGPRGGLIVSDPETASVVLRAPDLFPKTLKLLSLLGDNRFGANGNEWQIRRDLTQRTYLHAGTAKSRQAVAEVYRRRFSECKDTDSATIARAVMAASAEIFYQAFGCQVDVESMLEFFARARPLLMRLQYYSMMPPDAAELKLLQDETRAVREEYFAETRRSPKLSALLDGFQSNTAIEGFSASDEFMLNFFAAVESSSSTITIAIDRLGVHRAAQARLAQELPSDSPIPALECFVNETLRCYPAIPFVVREVASPTELEGRPLKAGSVVIVSIAGIHRHPDYWASAEVFDPARAEFVQDTYDRRAFIPFLSGPRTCGGLRLARFELSEGLKAFLEQFVVAREGDAISFEYGLAIRPKAFDRVRIARR